MITIANKVLLHVFKDFSSGHTITSLANALGLSRVGVWKILKRLSAEKYITVTPVGAGKTSASVIKINWDNPLVKKVLSLCLAEEALSRGAGQLILLNWKKRLTSLSYMAASCSLRRPMILI